MPRVTFTETSPSGAVKTYVLTDNNASSSDDEGVAAQGRIDLIPPTAAKSTTLGTDATWLQYLLAAFLPVGYPDSVSPDYTSYQLYDSLQALFSTTASLLASRAVLTTLGVGSATATTTLALYLSILQSTISNLSSILFAHHFSTRIAREVKFYRFFADIVNDIAFVLDVLSPSLPADSGLRIGALCAASACRAICGVCGGASKAVLSSHFAVKGNIGEVNAKDGSQETVVNLVGMWAGGYVVGRVEGTRTTWVVLLALLAGHLWANWSAVKCVRLRTLNEGRAQMVVQRVMQGKGCGVDVVGSEERVLGSQAVLGSRDSSLPWEFGSLKELLAVAGWRSQGGGRAFVGDASLFATLLDTFRGENYLLWWNRHQRRCVIVLKSVDNGDCGDVLKAMCQAYIIASEVESEKASEMEILQRSLGMARKRWPECLAAIRMGGWDLTPSSNDIITGSRLKAQVE